MSRLHLIVGVVTVVVFLGTGVYLRTGFPDLYAENESIRFLFRANHVYILFSGLLNIVAGLSLPFSEILWRKRVQQAGSWLLLVSSPVFLVAFIFEPMQASPMRPLTITSVFLSFVGVAFHAIASWRRKIPAQTNL